MEKPPQPQERSCENIKKLLEAIYHSKPLRALFGIATTTLLLLTPSSEAQLDRSGIESVEAARVALETMTVMPVMPTATEAIIFTPTAESTPESLTIPEMYAAKMEELESNFNMELVPRSQRDLVNAAAFLDVLTHGRRPIESYTIQELIELMEQTIGIKKGVDSKLADHILSDKGLDGYQCVEAYELLIYRENDTGVNTLPYLKGSGENAKQVFDNITDAAREQSKEPKKRGYKSFFLDGFNGKVIPGYQLEDGFGSGQLVVIHGGDDDPGHIYYEFAVDPESGLALIFNGNFELNEENGRPELNRLITIDVYTQADLQALLQANGATRDGMIGLESIAK